MHKKGNLYILSAPSGTGKTTVLRRLLELKPELKVSVSCTIRKPRIGEKDGVDYHFVSRAQFEEMLASGEFVEWAEVHGQLYGTKKAPLETWRAMGDDVILDIDTQGAAAVKQYDPEAVLIFLAPPSLEALESRLRGRGTEATDDLQRRLQSAKQELAEQSKYDVVIINDTVDEAAKEIANIITRRKAGVL